MFTFSSGFQSSKWTKLFERVAIVFMLLTLVNKTLVIATNKLKIKHYLHS